jgi:hypothetical protein
MALSPFFSSTEPLSSGGIFPSPQRWEDVINYTKFYIQIQTDQPCKISVYQCNANFPSTSRSTLQNFVYQNVNQVMILEGTIICNQISFVLLNTSSLNETNLFYSVLYK